MAAVEFLLNLVIGEDPQGKDVRVKDTLSKSEIDKVKEMEKEQSVHKLFFGFQEWHQNEYGCKCVEIDQFNEYLETFKQQ